MDYMDFKKELVKTVEERLGEGYKVEIQNINKINSAIQEGIAISKGGEKNYYVSHLEPLFDYYKEAETIEEIADIILEKYSNHWVGVQYDMTSFQNWDYAKKFVRRCLIKKEWNTELLEKLPNEDFLDLSVIYYLELNIDPVGQGETKINNELLKIWGITKEELNATAIANEKLYNPFIVKRMDMVIKESFSDISMSDEQEEIEMMEDEYADSYPESLPRMYVLLNKRRSKAAVGIMDTKILSRLADKLDSDLYILPSSIHEVVIISSKDAKDKDSLVDMVKDINETSVGKDEVLSDCIYVFRRQDEKVTYAR